MNPVIMITGIHTPESVDIHFEGLPHADELAKMRWTKLSAVVLALKNRLRHLCVEVNAMTVLTALQNLRGKCMVWISVPEHCIYSTNLPTDLQAEIVLPSEDAASVMDIILCKAMMGQYPARAITADAVPSGK